MLNTRRIRLGQHYPLPSPVHRLDARTKLVCVLALLVGTFTAARAEGVAILFLFALWVVWLAKLPPLQVMASLRSVLVLLLITALLQVFFSPGRVLWSWGPLNITNTGVENGVLYTLRLVLGVTLLSLLTMTTSPAEMLRGMEHLLRPLSRLGFPARETALVLAAALRFLPHLLSRAGDIALAQETRGADFSSGNPLRRARSLVTVLAPLFAACFRDADELGAALAARGHGGERTPAGKARFRASDLAAFVLVFGVVLVSRLLPAG